MSRGFMVPQRETPGPKAGAFGFPAGSFQFQGRNRHPVVRRWIGEACATTSDKDFLWAIETAATGGRGFEEPDRYRPAPVLIGCKTGLVGLDPVRGSTCPPRFAKKNLLSMARRSSALCSECRP